jgi:hypothetical protein
MLDKNFATLSPLLLLKSAPFLTQFINRNGNQREIVNNDESSLSFNILPIRPLAFGQLIENVCELGLLSFITHFINKQKL